MYSLEQVRIALKGMNLREVSRETGLHYETVRRVAQSIITNPDTSTLTALSDYFEQRDAEIRGV